MSANVVTQQTLGSLSPASRESLPLRQAGLVVAFSMLTMTAVTPFAEFSVFHKLILRE